MKYVFNCLDFAKFRARVFRFVRLRNTQGENCIRVSLFMICGTLRTKSFRKCLDSGICGTLKTKTAYKCLDRYLLDVFLWSCFVSFEICQNLRSSGAPNFKTKRVGFFNYYFYFGKGNLAK